MTDAPLAAGLVRDLAVAFGRQVRIQCVTCKRFVSGTKLPSVRCESCGTRYRHVEGSFYEIEEVPYA